MKNKARWQPIETAPKDGTVIDLHMEYLGGFAPAPGFYCKGGEWFNHSSGLAIAQHYGNADIIIKRWKHADLRDDDKADEWPCQQFYGGKDSAVMSESGLCGHDECNPKHANATT